LHCEIIIDNFGLSLCLVVVDPAVGTYAVDFVNVSHVTDVTLVSHTASKHDVINCKAVLFEFRYSYFRAEWN